MPLFTDDLQLMNSIGFDKIGFSVIQQILLNSYYAQKENINFLLDGKWKSSSCVKLPESEF